MTVIIAKREKKKIILACDNQTSWGWYKTDTKTDNSERGKIKQISDSFAIACSWSVQEITIFQRFCERTTPKWSNENDIYDFMVEFKDYCKKTMDKFEFKSWYIIVLSNKIFQVMYWFDVQEKKLHCALWSWMFEAMVALEMWGNAEKAVEMAIKFDRGCGGTIHTIEL